MFERLFSSLCVQIDLEGQGSISKQGDQLGGHWNNPDKK